MEALYADECTWCDDAAAAAAPWCACSWLRTPGVGCRCAPAAPATYAPAAQAGWAGVLDWQSLPSLLNNYFPRCHLLRPLASSMLVGKPPMSEILLITWQQCTARAWGCGSVSPCGRIDRLRSSHTADWPQTAAGDGEQRA